MQRIWITGISGLLGSALLKEFSQADSPVAPLRIIGIARNIPQRETFSSLLYDVLDITDRDAVFRLAEKEPPDVILHAAAMTNVDQCERHPGACLETNLRATQNIADCARQAKAKLCFFSTDYVFDGLAGPYREEDAPNPVNVYGRSKLLAEQYVQSELADGLVIRTTVLFGLRDVYAGKTDFVRWVVSALQRGEKISVVSDQFGNPTYVSMLAKSVHQLIRSNAEGIVHVAGAEWISRLDFAIAIARQWGLDDRLIKPVTTEALAQSAKRPLRGGLQCEKVVRLLGEERKPLAKILQGLASR